MDITDIRLLVIMSLLVLTGCDDTRAQKELPLGSEAPQFAATDQHGESISLANLLKEGPVVVVFYRGAWCSSCNRHMSVLQDSLQLFESFNAAVVAITPENFENIQKTVDKTSASFSIIWDQDHRIMDDYSVTWKLGFMKSVFKFFQGKNLNKIAENDDNVLPVPATYIINQDGSIIGSHFDKKIRKRMSVKDMLAVLGEFSIL